MPGLDAGVAAAYSSHGILSLGAAGAPAAAYSSHGFAIIHLPSRNLAPSPNFFAAMDHRLGIHNHCDEILVSMHWQGAELYRQRPVVLLRKWVERSQFHLELQMLHPCRVSE